MSSTRLVAESCSTISLNDLSSNGEREPEAGASGRGRIIQRESSKYFQRQVFVKEFPGFDEIILSFRKHIHVINHEASHKIWHMMLGSTAGIYLIVDTESGRQCVGSAYGEEGILGRWWTYANTHHGNNVVMMDLLPKYPDRYTNFQFSVLQTLPLSMSKDQVIQREHRYMKKLDSRTFGFN
jgi:hypothetical protein